MGKARRGRLEGLQLFDFLSVDAYNVTKNTSVHCDLRTSGLSRYIGLPWLSGRGTGESIVLSSLQLLKDPPLIGAAFVTCDSDLIQCESE